MELKDLERWKARVATACFGGCLPANGPCIVDCDLFTECAEYKFSDAPIESRFLEAVGELLSHIDELEGQIKEIGGIIGG